MFHLRIIKSIFLNIFLLFPFKFYGQADTSKKFAFFIAPSVGYMWQGANNVDIGLQPMLLLDAYKNHNNIGLLIAGNILFYNNSRYFTPTTKLRIMNHYRKRILSPGWTVSIGHSYTNIQKKYDHRITPELGIKVWAFDLTFGYNIPITKYKDGFTDDFRVALRFNSH